MPSNDTCKISQLQPTNVTHYYTYSKMTAYSEFQDFQFDLKQSRILRRISVTNNLRLTGQT